MSKKRNLSLVLSCIVASAAYGEETLSVVSWNVESGGAQPSAIADRIEAMNGVDVGG